MTYATRTDLESRYGADEIAQREGALPAGAAAKALADADALIDGYLGGRFGVPLNPVPGNVPRLAAVVARYYLLGDAVTDFARQEFEDAVKWLEGVAAGRIPLPEAAKADAPATGGTPVSRTKAKRFGAAGLESY